MFELGMILGVVGDWKRDWSMLVSRIGTVFRSTSLLLFAKTKYF